MRLKPRNSCGSKLVMITWDNFQNLYKYTQNYPWTVIYIFRVVLPRNAMPSHDLRALDTAVFYDSISLVMRISASQPRVYSGHRLLNCDGGSTAAAASINFPIVPSVSYAPAVAIVDKYGSACGAGYDYTAPARTIPLFLGAQAGIQSK